MPGVRRDEEGILQSSLVSEFPSPEGRVLWRGEMAKPEEMWQCQTTNCGYIYDPDRGDRKGKIPKGTRFEDLPEDWKCPVCGAGKKMFRPLAGPGSVAAEAKQG
jgi:rubredoxin